MLRTIQPFFIAQSRLFRAPVIFVTGLGLTCAEVLTMRKSVAISVVNVKLLCILNQAVCFHCHYYCCLLTIQDALSLDTENLLLLYPERVLSVVQELGALV